ncbi:hypothetical protein NEMBOFW57_005998 [Staphylotrichum longicolle]|uniref:Up-regulated during septation protein 1 domain-containing protein n=1 Tax=Staphylotrichum longicolle TaxID=669026 RepID=A0AAD4EY85_9PEZI|nr:hypothetical protein NEMBOFW57_005998 [Staphylotrichum longicolle]
MAHIADCLLDTDQDDLPLGLNNYIAKALSPQDSNESPERKYQLFPKDRQAATPSGKALDPEQAFALAMSQNGERSEKMTAVTGLRIRIKEHNLIRRRKISVPELGPMTTVQEAAMDSPIVAEEPHTAGHSYLQLSCPAIDATDFPQPPPVWQHTKRCSHPLGPNRGFASRQDALHSAFRLANHTEICRDDSHDNLDTANTIPTLAAAVGMPKETASEASTTPKTELSDPIQRVTLGHRRHQSESGSIMERGRPRKRSETSTTTTLKRTGSKRSKSSERRAFEQLPKGWKASDALNVLSPQEVASLQKQALQQAARFEVLRQEDVDSLSRELRQLDERTEYLRATYIKLRAGRRNLHARICQYLRSPRTAKFSHEAMLKQEETVAELDSSIDEWVNKLERAENRRTRVRQKLLEHVAAAATLGVSAGNVLGVSESLQLAIGVRPLNATDLSTPPRSPVKTSFTPTQTSSSPSPHRAHVPSTILEQPLFEEAASMDAQDGAAAVSLRRAETIRVYADNAVFDLLADVENTITSMGGGDISIMDGSEPISDAERKKLCRTRSHELLSGSPARKPLPISKLEEKPSSSSLSSVVTTPPAAEVAPADLFLTSAVFKPT